MDSVDTFGDALLASIRRYDPTDEQLGAMRRHWDLVKRWNNRINLTAILDDESAAVFHYRDSLEPISHLHHGDILDVGSGAGFPGIPIAILTGRPVALLEPRNKRATFLRVVRSELGLESLTILVGRSTDPPSRRFSNVLTRATFSDMAGLQSCFDWVIPGGRVIAMRSSPLTGLTSLTHEYEVGGKERVLEIWKT